MRSIATIFNTILSIVLFIVCTTTLLHASDFELEPLADLSKLPNIHWQQIVNNKKSQNQYFLLNKQGDVYKVINGELDSASTVSLQQNNTSLIKYHDIVLHPDFASSQQPNYLTFFTSHTEKKSTKRNARLLVAKNDTNFAFDLVITQWKFTNPSTSHVESPREVFRVAAPTINSKAENLHFEPYKRAWSEDYGLLYFTIPFEKSYQQHQFYSGSLHRISPAAFGLKQYTIPNNNPFIKNDDLYDSLLLTGQGALKEIHWLKGKVNKVLISVDTDKKRSYYLNEFGSDNRNKQAKAQLFSLQSPSSQSSFLYHNSNLKQQRNSLLIFHKTTDWMISSHDLINNKEPVNIWQNTDPRIKQSNNLALYQFNQNQSVILHDKDNKVLLKLAVPSNESQQIKAELTPSSETERSYFWPIFLFVTFICVGLFYVLKKHQQNIVRNMLRKQFARFELSKDQNQLKLFGRHEQKASAVINVSEITSAVVCLNDQQLNIVSSEHDSFSNKLQQQLEMSFANEKRNKMVDDKTRKVDLQLTINNEDIYNICLYLRKGNQRLTKPKFSAVLETIIDWQWFISQRIHPNTEARIVKVIEPKVSAPTKNHSINTKAVTAVNKAKEDVTQKNTVATDSGNNEVSVRDLSLNNTSKHSKTNQDTGTEESIVEALNKLANLKQKGFLTELEFNNAKAKLLKNLIDE